MKFLLTAINAKYIHSNPAIYSLRAYAGKELESHIELAEYTINQQMQDIMADIYSRRPDAIGFSCYIWNWNMVQELLLEIPKVLPDTDIWLGGPEVTYDAERILEHYPKLTGIMVGEGEVTFKELMEYYVFRQTQDENGSDAGKTKCPEQVAGLCLHTGYTKARPLTNLTDLPFLYEDLEPFANKIIYYESSRGCPYRCSYCLSSIDKKVRLRDIDVVKKELQFFLDHKVKQVKFVDRTFNCDHKHAMEIWKYIYKHDNGVTNFHFEISADILREEEIALLRKFRPGLAQLEIGVQSTNEQTIKAINRSMNVERLERIVASVREGNNIHQHLDLIAGLPYEDYESFGRSFNRVYAMKPDQLQLGFLKVLKGSEMAERAEEFGICFGEKPPYEVLYTKWLAYSDVLRLKRVEEMVELYYNSNQYTHTLPFLERAFATPFEMFEQMADYFEEKGYFMNSPARAYRYQVLLDFAQKYDTDNTSIYQELLTYDLYLRENVKSRPEFCTDLTDVSYKDAMRNFYRAEEENRQYLPEYGQYDWKQLSKMTHLEPFHYPVWDLQKLLQEQGKMQSNKPDGREYILFDYQNRNP
ncbi:MAG: B12-binding domain-containing radical SAM protein, partial [Acetatifactor sp.]|nr:B12-binding domain-containing radical SAM protein [Acetatifactor sp.]